MRKRKRPALNRACERRITYEIIFDAYTAEVRAIGWHCHLDDSCAFPSRRVHRCARNFAPQERRGGRGARDGAGERLHERDVRTRAVSRAQVGVPLVQLDLVKREKGVCEAMEDWRTGTICGMNPEARAHLGRSFAADRGGL